MRIQALVIFLLLNFGVKAQTIIADSVVVSGSWSLSGSPYIVQGRAIVPQGQTLVIDAGVQVRFASNTAIYNDAIWDPDTNIVGSLRVNGRLIAKGTVSDSIEFIADGQGYWGSVFLLGGVTDSFLYCKFQNMYQIAGHNSSLGYPESYGGLFISLADTLFLEHSLFESNHYAVQTDWVVNSVSNYIRNSIFRNNVDSNKIITLSTSIVLQGPAFIYNTVFDNSALVGENLTLANCILMNADSFAIFPYGTALVTCRIVNCLLYNNPKAFRSAHQMYIYNSILLDNVGYDTTFCCGNALNKTVFDGPIAGTWSVTTNNYPNTNPNLINPMPVNGDFHLLPSSVCINNGDTTGLSNLIPGTDLDGNPRYNGTIDIGPYEFQGTVGVASISGQQLTVFPNPCEAFFHIKGDYTFEEHEIRIFSLLGEALCTQRFHERIQVANLKPGCYLLEIRSDQGQAKVVKFVKE